MLHAQGPEPNIAFSQTAESSQLHCKVCPSLLHLLLIPAITCHNYASRAEILVLVSFFSCTTGNAPASLYRLISVDANTFCLALPAAHLRATMSTYVYFFKGILSCRKTMHATCGRQLCNLLGPAVRSRFAASFSHYVIAVPHERKRSELHRQIHKTMNFPPLAVTLIFCNTFQ